VEEARERGKNALAHRQLDKRGMEGTQGLVRERTLSYNPKQREGEKLWRCRQIERLKGVRKKLRGHRPKKSGNVLPHKNLTYDIGSSPRFRRMRKDKDLRWDGFRVRIK